MVRRIGQGSYGEVWLARNAVGTWRAVKVVHRARFRDPRPYEREFIGIQKYEPVSRTNEGLVDVLQLGRNDAEGYFYYVMELADSENAEGRLKNAERGAAEEAAALYVPKTLGREIRARGRLPVEECVPLGIALCLALGHLHRKGLIHRDVKPSNVIFVNGVPKLADIGLVTDLGEARSFVGTEGFIPPEGPNSSQADLYALGKVLYEASMGKDRHEFPEPFSRLELNAESRALMEFNAVLLRACAPDSKERYRSAEEMNADLALLHSGQSVQNRHALERRIKLMRRLGLGTLGIMLLGIFPYCLAIREAHLARAAARREAGLRQHAQRYVYGANMNLAQQAWEQANVRRLRELLDQTSASPERGFEWYYWQRQVRLELATLQGHHKAVKAGVFSPDGRRIVTASEDQTAKVWDAKTGQELTTLKGHNGLISSAAFSPDGQLIVTGSADGTVKLWQPNGRELLTLAKDDFKVNCVAFSPDGQHIATAGDVGAVKLYDVRSRKELLTLRHSSPVLSLSFSHDGRWIATGSRDGTSRIWQGSDGRELLALAKHGGAVCGVAFSPDSLRLVTASEDCTAKVWDTGSGREFLTLQGHASWVNSVAFSPEGRTIATGSEDMLAKLWDAAAGKEIATLEGHTDRVLSVAFSGDGRLLLTGSADNTAKVWDTTVDNDVLGLKASSASLQRVVFCPSGERFVTWGLDSSARVCELAGGRQLFALKARSGSILAASFSPDGTRIVTGSSVGTATVCLGSNEQFTLGGHKGAVRSVAFSPDGRRIVTGGGDGTAKVWDAATGEALLTLRGHETWIYCAIFSPDGRNIATGSEDRTAKLWDAVTGKELRTFKGHSGRVYTVAFSPDGQWLATGGSDKTARIWNSVSGTELLALKGHKGVVFSVAFSPDGHRLVSGNQLGSAIVWDVFTGNELLALKGHSASIHSTVFSPDGSCLLMGSDDGQAKRWESASVEQVTNWLQAEAAAARFSQAQEHEQSAAAERARALSAQDPGAIKEWLVLLPISLGDGRGHGATRQWPIADERGLRPRPGERVKTGEGELVWTPVELKDYLLDFNHLTGGVTEWSVAYAVCYVWSDSPQKDLFLKVGSDDQASVYLNGKLIHQSISPRAYVADQDTVAEVSLDRGMNVLVFKVLNETADWKGSVRFTDYRGRPLERLRITVDPGPKQHH